MTRLWIKQIFLIPPHPLTNFGIQKYQNEPRLKGVFSRDNLPTKVKDGAYVMKLGEYVDTRTHWIALFCTEVQVIYFNNFGVKHVPKETEKFIEPKNIKINTFRIASNKSIMCGYSCTEFIDFMFVVKALIDYTSLFSPLDFEKNDCIILKYFKDE